MIIISKYKDYYDFLQGVYGRDEKVILDRSKGFISTSIPKEADLVKLFVLGKFYDMIFYKDKWWERESLRKEGFIHVEYLGEYRIEPKPNKEYKLDIEERKKADFIEHPIAIWKYGNWEEYPRLSDFNFASIINPHDMWIGLYNWLSKVPEIKSKQDNIQKLEAHGFDKKTSFRPKINLHK